MKLKTVFRWSNHQRMFRLFRVCWTRGTVGVPGGGYSAKLTVALAPRLFRFGDPWCDGWSLTLLGIRIHYIRSYGGIFD